jgi:hypothetical protein
MCERANDKHPDLLLCGLLAGDPVELHRFLALYESCYSRGRTSKQATWFVELCERLVCESAVKKRAALYELFSLVLKSPRMRNDPRTFSITNRREGHSALMVLLCAADVDADTHKYVNKLTRVAPSLVDERALDVVLDADRLESYGEARRAARDIACILLRELTRRRGYVLAPEKLKLLVAL